MKKNYSVRERIRFGSESSPIFHKVAILSGVLLTLLCVYSRGSVVISGGTVNGTSMGENPGNLLVQQFDIDAISKGKYPGGKIRKTSPRTVNRRQIFDKGVFQPDLSLGAAGLTGAAGTFTINTRFPLRFALPGLRNPIETALKLDEYEQIMLQLTNGSRNGQFSGNDRVFDYTSLFHEIISYLEVPGAGFVPPAVLYDDDRIINIAAANARLAIDGELPKTEAYLDALFIAETTNQALADTIINRITLQDPVEQFFDLYEDEIKGEQLDYVTDAAQSMTGLYHVPMTRNEGQGILVAGAVANVNAVLDVSMPGTDRILLATRRVGSPRG